MAQEDFMQAPRRAAELIAGFLEGRLTVDEVKELDDWICENDENMQLFEKLTDKHNIEWAREWFRSMDVNAALKKVKTQVYYRRKKTNRTKIISVAAAAALLLCVAVVAIRYSDFRNKNINNQNKPAIASTVTPGGKKAVLITGKGEKIDLSSADARTISLGHANISNHDHVLSYEKSNQQEAVIHTVHVPRGGEYQVVLADGTKAWLNAESSMSYASVFSDAKREVSVKGEVYFEVAHDPQKPFIVKTNGSTVTVKGTRFNIRSYENNNEKVSLLQGSIELAAGKNRRLLKPQEEAIISGKQISVYHSPATGDAIGWTKGMFSFYDEHISAVMDEIARWYDVEVKFTEKTNTKITGDILRSSSLQEVLDMLEDSGDLIFTLQGRTISVRSK